MLDISYGRRRKTRPWGRNDMDRRKTGYVRDQGTGGGKRKDMDERKAGYIRDKGTDEERKRHGRWKDRP